MTRKLASTALAFAMGAASLLAASPALHTSPLAGGLAQASGGRDAFRFAMVRSTGAAKANCLPTAQGLVTITHQDQNERMRVQVASLPPNTDFDFFVTQLPDAPFGVAWYQSDLHTDASGYGDITVQGIFNVETFSLSQAGPAGGSDPLQDVSGPARADTSVVFRGTHQYHLGLWFNNPQDAAQAGCPATVTPFNGEQHAGIQALSTRNFPADAGPLSQVEP